MRHRVLVPSGAVTLAMVIWLGAPVLAGQAPSGTKTFDPRTTSTDAAVRAAADAAKTADAAARANWTPPRTPWGDPDLRGYWLTATYTPLERPRELGNKAMYTEEEAVAAFRSAAESDAGADSKTVHYDWKEYGMDAWQSPVRPNRRTSLIVDPADGRIPALTPEAQKRQAAARAVAAARSQEVSVQTLGSLYTRCITGNNAGPMLRGGNPGSDQASQAAGVTAEAQLFQAPGYVVVVTQSNSDGRIIPLDGRPHLPSDVRLWLGDARGRWDGNTLVVETTNYNETGARFNARGATAGLTLTERFTLMEKNTLQYEFTLNDPATWTRPWTAQSLLPRIEPPLYEFACHEHNYGVMNVVKGAQIREAEAAATPGSAR